MEPAKPHVLCVSAPSQGHIKPMLDLAKLLHHRGFNVTFVNTEFNHRRFLKSRGAHSLDGLDGFRFEAISDGLPPSEAEATQELGDLIEISRRSTLGPLGDLVGRLNCYWLKTFGGQPPIVFFVPCQNLLQIHQEWQQQMEKFGSHHHLKSWSEISAKEEQIEFLLFIHWAADFVGCFFSHAKFLAIKAINGKAINHPREASKRANL